MRVTLRPLGPAPGLPNEGRVVSLAAGAKVADALRAAGLHPETVLVARGEARTIVPDDEPLAEGDELLVLRVVTGG